MSMTEVLYFLSEHEGLMFTNSQLCEALRMNSGTLAGDISNLRRHWIYQRYFRTATIARTSEKTVYHYVVRGTKQTLDLHNL